jgi:hypothetical protein
MVVTRNWNFNQNMTSQPFRWNTINGLTRGQFGGSGYDPISPTSQGMEGTDSRYQVREGDTLAGIAQQVWGDSSLWYMIAEANGLAGAQSPAAGTSLIIPDKVTNVHNSARTFEVYDPNRALGDLSPTAAKPPQVRHVRDDPAGRGRRHGSHSRRGGRHRRSGPDARPGDRCGAGRQRGAGRDDGQRHNFNMAKSFAN